MVHTSFMSSAIISSADWCYHLICNIDESTIADNVAAALIVNKPCSSENLMHSSNLKHTENRNISLCPQTERTYDKLSGVIVEIRKNNLLFFCFFKKRTAIIWLLMGFATVRCMCICGNVRANRNFILVMSNMTFVSLSICSNENAVRWTRIVFDLFAPIQHSIQYTHTHTHERELALALSSVIEIIIANVQCLFCPYSQAHTARAK